MTRLRLGLVGCGAVAELYHLPAIAMSEEVELVAVADLDSERAARLAKLMGVSHVAATHDELGSLVDAAVVAVPNYLHAAVSSDLLQAGVHVLVEKPMATTVEDCESMIAAARAGGAVLAVGHDFRFFPVATFAKEILSGELIGPVSGFDMRQSAGRTWPLATGYVLRPETAGGGVLIDFGVHMLDLLLWWLGELAVVEYRDDARGGVEGECEATLRLESGAEGFVELSRSRDLRDTFIVHGERASLELGLFEPTVLRLAPAGASRVLEGNVVDREFEAAPLRTVFARQLADFVGAIRTGRDPLVPGSAGRRVVALVQACYLARRPLPQPWVYPAAYETIGGPV